MKTVYAVIAATPFLSFSAQVRQICEPIFQRFGISFFDYARYYPDNTTEYFFSNEAYIRFFFDHPAYRLTPIAIPPGKYLWSTYIAPELLEKIHEQFDLYHGITYIKQQEHYTECFNFAASKKNENILNVFLNQEDILEYFVIFFINTIEGFRKKNRNSRIVTPEHLLSVNKEEIPFDRESAYQFITECNQRLQLRKNSYPIVVKEKMTTFTSRELQCLALLNEGFSSKQIAKKINRSVRTVDIFRTNILNKTHCYSTLELFEKLDHSTRSLLKRLL